MGVRHREFDKQILHNGVVHTMDDADTTVPAVGFAAGRVTGAGSLEDVRRATPGADEYDLSGQAVYPGFIDAHHHLCFAATYANFPEVRPPPFRSLAAILAEIETALQRMGYAQGPAEP